MPKREMPEDSALEFDEETEKLARSSTPKNIHEIKAIEVKLKKRKYSKVLWRDGETIEFKRKPAAIAGRGSTQTVVTWHIGKFSCFKWIIWCSSSKEDNPLIVFWIDVATQTFTLDFQKDWVWAFYFHPKALYKTAGFITAPVYFEVYRQTLVVGFKDNNIRYVVMTGRDAWNWVTGERVEPFTFQPLEKSRRLKKAIGYRPKRGDHILWDDRNIYFRRDRGALSNLMESRFITKGNGVYIGDI